MTSRLKHVLLGSPLPTQQALEKRLNKVRALAAFSPDALSSIAYANQEIYLGLVIAGAAGLSLAWPIGIAIAAVLAIAAASYFQTIHAYPTGGGSYTVARENLGTLPGLVAASALMIDYILTGAVSLTAGVDALASAFPFLWGHRVATALVLLGLITLVNLRGMQESSSVMAVPVYLFLISYLVMLAWGAYRLIVEGPGSLTVSAPLPVQPLTSLLVLHAFASGCTALTGIEAISNGVSAFKQPESKNAGRTLVVMALLMSVLFVGSIGLTQGLAVVAGPQETILSALARRLLGSGPFYLLIQLSTMAILTVAANTSFAGFPRVAAILAGDSFLPRQLKHMGDRLVFSNGILLLSLAVAALIVLFGGDSHALVPLFAVGAFLAFTLSQSGMVIHWLRTRGSRWYLKAFINGLGACATGITLFVVAISKFTHGAWISIVLIPIFVVGFLSVKRHYRQVARQLSLRGLPPSLKPMRVQRLVVPVSGVHRGMVDAIRFAQSISTNVTGVYVELEPGQSAEVQKTWKQWWPDIPLVVMPSPYRSIIGPFLDYLDETDRQNNDGQQAVVVLPEFIPARWWQSWLHNQTSWMLKTALLYRRRERGYQRVIIDVPYHLHE